MSTAVPPSGFLVLVALILLGACGAAPDRAAIPAEARQCAVCHSFEKSGPRMAGPNLFGIIGEKAGARPGFPFSPAMKASGIVWTPERIDAFIAAPLKTVPGTRMAFDGVSDPAKRHAIVEYIQSLNAKESR